MTIRTALLLLAFSAILTARTPAWSQPGTTRSGTGTTPRSLPATTTAATPAPATKPALPKEGLPFVLDLLTKRDKMTDVQAKDAMEAAHAEQLRFTFIVSTVTARPTGGFYEVTGTIQGRNNYWVDCRFPLNDTVKARLRTLQPKQQLTVQGHLMYLSAPTVERPPRMGLRITLDDCELPEAK